MCAIVCTQYDTGNENNGGIGLHCRYRALRTGHRNSTDNYGIIAEYRENGRTVCMTVCDISSDRGEVVRFARWLAACRASPLHLKDLAEDYVNGLSIPRCSGGLKGGLFRNFLPPPKNSPDFFTSLVLPLRQLCKHMK